MTARFMPIHFMPLYLKGQIKGQLSQTLWVSVFNRIIYPVDYRHKLTLYGSIARD